MKREIDRIIEEKNAISKLLCELLSDVMVHSKPSNGSLIVSKIQKNIDRVTDNITSRVSTKVFYQKLVQEKKKKIGVMDECEEVIIEDDGLKDRLTTMESLLKQRTENSAEISLDEVVSIVDDITSIYNKSMKMMHKLINKLNDIVADGEKRESMVMLTKQCQTRIMQLILELKENIQEI